jgi:hypothetical protein
VGLHHRKRALIRLPGENIDWQIFASVSKREEEAKN